MIKKFLVVVNFLLIPTAVVIFISFFIVKPDRGQISGIATKSSSVNVDISIGEYQFTLFGYTSPSAFVTIQGMGIYDQTYAKSDGYFEFNNRFSPFTPREACLTAQDQFGRTTSPTCIPPFPTKYNVTIGPVLIPPTLSLDKENYWVGDEVKLSGQTTPNSEVNFSVFTKEGGLNVIASERSERSNLISGLLRRSLHSLLAMTSRSVEAFSFPDLTTRSDRKGNFSLSLPSSRPEFFRLFAQTSYENGQSPESVKLHIQVLPVWMIIIQIFMFIFALIKSRLLEIIIIGEIVGLALFFLRRYLHPHVIAKNRALALRSAEGLAIREKYPLTNTFHI